MPNIATILKQEIARIGKRQANALVKPVRAQTAQLRLTVAALKRQNAALQRDLAWVQQQVKRLAPAVPAAKPEEVAGRWISGKGVAALRRKLGLSQEHFALLVGASAPTVVAWEKGKGKLEFRKKDTMSRLEAARQMGAREARELLQREHGVDFKKTRKPRVKPATPAPKQIQMDTPPAPKKTPRKARS